MARRNSKSTGVLTPQQLAFVLAWNGNARDAARKAGYRNAKRTAQALMVHPAILNAILQRQESMLKESGKRLGQDLDVCRADLINSLWKVAQRSPDDKGYNVFAQIKAHEVLAEIMCMKINRNPGIVKELESRTQEEVDFFVANGYFPTPEDLGQEQNSAAQPE